MEKLKNIYEDLVYCIKEFGPFSGLYRSDLFSPIYSLVNAPRRVYSYVARFIYYGRVGASYTQDYDAQGGHTLLYYHLLRVQKFMKSKNTHLTWNSSGNTGLMRKLDELVELGRRRVEDDDFNTFYHYGKAVDKYGRGVLTELDGGKYYTYVESDEIKEIKRRAARKDMFIAQQLDKRYHHMVQKYIPMFLD